MFVSNGELSRTRQKNRVEPRNKGTKEPGTASKAEIETSLPYKARYLPHLAEISTTQFTKGNWWMLYAPHSPSNSFVPARSCV
jgi:hypothetical protein